MAAVCYAEPMSGPPFDAATIAVVVFAALAAGFTTGFAGFGTTLVASGLWLMVLPPAMVPPLAAMASVVAQLVGLVAVRKAFDWPRATPFLLGGAVGVPLGVAALAAVSPKFLKTFLGAFLVAYTLYQLSRRPRTERRAWGGRSADGLVGLGGGFLGGFAGLSGPLPLIWLQLQGGDSSRQRAVYQPFNLIVLALASLGMGLAGEIGSPVLWLAVLCLPPTLIGAAIGARIYHGVSHLVFQRVVLCLLLVSGCILIGQALNF